MNTAKIERLQSLLAMPLEELELQSETKRSQWCRWFNGAGFSSTTLEKIALRLDLEPILLFWFITKRQAEPKGQHIPTETLKQEENLSDVTYLNNLCFIKKAG
jgi:hypothetical protein